MRSMNHLHQRIISVSEKLKDRRIRICILSLIVLAQILLIAYWTTQRSNYFIDELFSFGYAHSYTFDKKDIMYINRTDAFQYEEWVDNHVLKKQLEIAGEESLLHLRLPQAVNLLLTRRNYHGILNILLSLFSGGKMSMYPPIILNLLLFVLVQVIIYRTMKEMTGSFAVSALTVMMYGFSMMAISTCLYVRFYELVTLLLLLAIRIHQKMWRTDSLLTCELWTIVSMALLYFALKNSELVLVIAAGLIGGYTLLLLLGRQQKKALLYFFTIFPIGVFYLIRKTHLLDIAVRPETYSHISGAEGWITKNILTVNAGRSCSLFFRYLEWISDLMFGSWYVLCSFLVLILILLEIRFLGTGKKSAQRKDDLHMAKSGTERIFFLWLIVIITAVYYAFALLAALPAQRYFMFYVPMLTMIHWGVIDSLTRQMKYRAEILILCFIFVCVEIMAAQLIRPDRIDYVYKEDRALIRDVKESGIDSAVAIYTNEGDSNHAVYDCIINMPDNAKLYPVDHTRHSIDTADCPEEFLIWIHRGRLTDNYIEDLTANGYLIEEFGKTHASDVYIAKKPR